MTAGAAGAARSVWLADAPTVNTRDLAGMPTSWGKLAPGRLFRGPVPTTWWPERPAPPAGFAFRTLVDLRGDDEVAAHPACPQALGPDVKWVRLPVRGAAPFPSGPPQPSDYVRGYAALLEPTAAVTADVVRLLAEPGRLPAQIGCTLGKDRTGVVVALLLAALGAPADRIAGDYALTARRLRPGPGPAVWDLVGRPEADFARRVHTVPSTIRHVLDEVEERYAGAAALLGRFGIVADDLAAVGQALTARSPADDESDEK
ncbi:tyrosine-protein phosphatase [Micromonospora echinofusca]|uniref:tyrosine-protein phosphatase n=1 Tax=Micromonospora echinofusca TaxID=47858 RepID=UPI0033D722BD